jgi:hydrogenase expression/formation protein HypE
MAEEAACAGVEIVTGDTKVVNRGKCDKIFINTSGLGIIDPRFTDIGTGKDIRPGDRVLINGTIGDHGMAVLAARKELNIRGVIQSDCASLNGLIARILECSGGVKFMRDPTRGGLATVLAELAAGKPYGIMTDESDIPVQPQVRSFCELLGFDPMYVANEGKVVVVADAAEAGKILELMRDHPLGREARVIGEITGEYPGRAWIKTGVGGKRILDMLAGEQLPRIC